MMTEIHKSPDCGNSPKSRFAQEIALALETGEIDPAVFAGDVVWRDGNQTRRGPEALAESAAGRETPRSVVVHHAIAHGKTGMASGETTLSDGAVRGFCHVFEFTSAKAAQVAEISSYHR